MKTRKVLSFATATVMALASMPVLSASAEEVLLGDVDQDGVITGHDSAMVSRHLYDDTYSLSDEQLALADVNGDGTVNQTDLEWIHENEVYYIGNFNLNPEKELSSLDLMLGAYNALVVSAYNSAGADLDIVQLDVLHQFSGTPDESYKELRYLVQDMTLEISDVQYNLLDANADGIVDIMDAYNLLKNTGYKSCGASFYPVEGRYDLMNNAPRVVE